MKPTFPKDFLISTNVSNKLRILVCIYVIYQLIFWGIFSSSRQGQEIQHLNADDDRSVESFQAPKLSPSKSDSCTQNNGIITSSHEINTNSDSDSDSDNSGHIYYPPPVPPNIDTSPLGTFRIAAQPRYGKHRCNQNAIMAFAYGYQLPQLIHFMTSLWQTGYDGDLVLAVGTNLTNETREFLEYNSRTRPGLVVYEIPLLCQRNNSCQVVNLLEKRQLNSSSSTTTTTTSTTNDWTMPPDERPFRRVSVIRYEYYWAWTTRYNPTSLILFTDARDVYFQRDPMKILLAHQSKSTISSNNETLIFFEEALRINESKANKKWIQKTYSNEVEAQMSSFMVICSGTTLGGQPAIETYARAIVNEFDKTKCKRCANKHDQCFHNYLIHQNRLIGANDGKISKVIVHPQGEGGLVNTVGMVSESHQSKNEENNDGNNNTKSLQQLGLVDSKTHEILENDRKTVSAVVHMYDRDEEMKVWVDQQIQRELTNLNN
jgi:hypothetical protein